MTVLSLLRLREPAQFAGWYRASAAYAEDVIDGMGFERGGVDHDAAARAMRAGRTRLSKPEARAVTATLLADAAFAEPFCEWMPLWYELGLLVPNRIAAARLRAVALQYARTLDHATAPRYSRPRDVYVAGDPPTEHVSGFRDRFVLASAVLDLEWFVHVARASGTRVPARLVDRTREESVAYYTGRRRSLSPEVRRFQANLFRADEWVRRVDESYGLNSTLLGVWSDVLREERERLESQL